jgi:hypothetical protein
MTIFNPSDLSRIVSGIDKNNPRIRNTKVNMITTRELNPKWAIGTILSSLNTSTVVNLNNGTNKIALADIDGFGADGPIAS